MNCGHCGELNLERAKFCRLCGNDMKFEADRLPLNSMFFTLMIGAMLVMLLVSLIYFVIRVNVIEQKLDNNQINVVYNKM